MLSVVLGSLRCGQVSDIAMSGAHKNRRTSVLAGSTIIFNDLEGVPPFPQEIDDDYITAHGCLPHPPGHISYMTSWIVAVQLFRVLSECQIRQRTYRNNKTAGPDVSTQLTWVRLAIDRVRYILDGLPAPLQTTCLTSPSPDRGQRRIVVHGDSAGEPSHHGVVHRVRLGMSACALVLEPIVLEARSTGDRRSQR